MIGDDEQGALQRHRNAGGYKLRGQPSGALLMRCQYGRGWKAPAIRCAPQRKAVRPPSRPVSATGDSTDPGSTTVAVSCVRLCSVNTAASKAWCRMRVPPASSHGTNDSEAGK